MPIVANLRDAKRMQCKASIVIDGLSGSGKTGLMLMIAYVLSGQDWKKLAVVDTENKSADLYVGTKLSTGEIVGGFKVGDLTADDGYKPSYYAAYRDAAIAAGCKVVGLDSISHMWSYKGGVLDMVNDAQKSNTNKYTAWGGDVAVEKAIIMSLVRHPKIHCISTVRVKEKMELVTGDDGKTKPVSLGEQQIIMPDFKYEPDLVLSMVSPGRPDGTPPVCLVTKSRYAPFILGEQYQMTPELIEQLRLFLEEGTSPEELEEMQRQDYVQAITKFLDENPNTKNIWGILKENAGVKDVALKDMTLKTLKLLFSQVTS